VISIIWDFCGYIVPAWSLRYKKMKYDLRVRRPTRPRSMVIYLLLVWFASPRQYNIVPRDDYAVRTSTYAAVVTIILLWVYRLYAHVIGGSYTGLLVRRRGTNARSPIFGRRIAGPRNAMIYLHCQRTRQTPSEYERPTE